MTVETLSSNVVNYLVWRYLQEAGYGTAALHLSRCWIRDPQSLPFAHHVQPHALVNLVQDGLWFDKLQAEAANVEPRYHFGRDHGRPYSARNGTLLTLDQGIPAHELAEQANGHVQDPPSKKPAKTKKKKANGLAEPPRNDHHLNGDPMDIEPNGAAHAPPSVNSVRAESEAIVSEAESPTVADLPISTLSIGQSTDAQTDVVADLAPNTTFIPGPTHPQELVEHIEWGPPEAPVLLIAGRSLLNMRMINNATDDDPTVAVKNVKHLFPMKSFYVTAFCWISDSELAVSAREEIVNEAGETMMMDKLFKVIEGGEDYQVISSTAGLINTLRWNRDKELLLSISTDGERGSIKIWKNHNDPIPAWAEFTDSVIFDALWISDSAFVVCGIELFRIYEIDDALKPQRTYDTKVTWETVKYESSSGIVAALGIEDGSSVLGIVHPNSAFRLQTHPYPDQDVTDLDFQKRTDAASIDHAPAAETAESPVLLATSSMSGTVHIWDANAPFQRLKALPTTGNSQAFRVAFSPDGTLLAAAGPDAVTVWHVEKREVPLANWCARAWSIDKWNPSVDGQFCLGWDPDSSRLCVSLANQIAIIPITR